jgi:DNA-binding NtrC family response regulator
MAAKVLLVDDDPIILHLVAAQLKAEGIESVGASTGAEALRRLEEERPAAVVLDLGLPDIPGKDLLARIHVDHPAIPVVMLTAADGVEDIVECMRLGASDYVPKSPEPTRLVASVRNAVERGSLRTRVELLARELRRGEGFSALLGFSPAMRRAVDLLRRASASDVTVLLEGESGTGKEVAARAVHAEGARRTGPFVAVNCGAIPVGLIESELFGHERGAFTGAVAARKGRFEEADGGTLFLDEVGDLRIDLQVKLLRVLQERKVQRVGGTGTRALDVRVMAATNRDLRALLAAGAFREDLYYRLSVFPVRLPALREREGDIPLLAAEFLRRFGVSHRRPVDGFSRDASQALEAYHWPGNVRELENVVERAVLMEDGLQVSLGSLPDPVVEAPEGGNRPAPGAAARAADPPAPAGAARAEDIRPLDEEEKRIILRALDATAWNIQEAAARLGISRATIYRKIERYGIEPGSARTAAST